MKKHKTNLESEEILELIGQTMGDTKYVLDDSKPYRGIIKTLAIWILLYASVSLFFFMTEYLNNTYELYNTTWFAPFNRVSNIILFSSIPIIYYLLVSKIQMTIKEKTFLLNWLPIPIILSLFRMLFPISFYLNTDIMLQLYSTLPFDQLINIIGLFIILMYLKDTLLKILLFANSIYMVISTIWISHFIKTLESNPLENQIYYILTIVQQNGIVIIISFLALTLYYRRKNYEKKLSTDF